MTRPIPLCAIGMFIAFFMPWMSFEIFSISGFQMARVGMDYANKTGGAGGIIWLWLVPTLAFITAIAGGKNTMGRVLAVITGTYPWAWLAYWYFELGRTGGKEAAKFIQEGLLQVVGFGGYATLGCAGALIFLGFFGKASAVEEQ